MVAEGDDLAALILSAAQAGGDGPSLVGGDVVAVTGKIVSKAEGRLVDLSSVEPSPRAHRLAAVTDKDARVVELVLRESAAVIRARPGVLLVTHTLGFTSAMAGIDASNVGRDDHVLLLPENPQRSAERLQEALSTATGVPIGVVITDSHGRPFRVGNTGVALGVAGLDALVELEGEPDLFGRALSTASKFPLADLVASAAVLLGGEGSQGTPVVIVRGLGVDGGRRGSVADLVRPVGTDMFAVPDRDYG